MALQNLVAPNGPLITSLQADVRRCAPPRSPDVAIYMHDLAGGGVERQTITLAQELLAGGLSVVVVLHRMRGELRDMLPSSVPVVDLRSRRTLHDIPLLARFLRRERPSVLISSLDHNNVAAVLAARLAGTGTDVVICQHNSLSSAFSGSLNRSYRLIPTLYRLLAPFTNAAVAVSEGIANELHTLAHIPRHKINLIHNAVIDSGFRLRAEQQVTHPWLEDPKVPVFVTAGRLVPLKDHETLLRGLAIHRRHRQSRLLVLGTGPLRDHLEALTRKLGIGDAVEFLGFQENPLPYFRRADAFVLSSYSEGFGNVLVEAMGCGTPVISTDCEHGPAEILDQGRYGALVPPRSPQALAEALDMVAGLSERWPSGLLKARAAQFSNVNCAAAYIQLCHSLAADRRRGEPMIKTSSLWPDTRVAGL
jgi:glycosyltransferase involved in cell wall biosynthesis